jgi:signal transduction histidine kinase
MKTKLFPLFRRTYWVIFLLIAVLGTLFTGITYLAITSFFEASTQLLNKDVAAHIARFTSPYGREGFDRRKADSVFYDAMVISPSAEVYFLDTTGRVIYFHGKKEEIKEWQVLLGPIERYLASGGKKHVVDVDPRDPERWKIFSAAAVEGGFGYIYVILGSQQYRSVSQMLFNSRITPMVLGSVSFLLAVSLLITVLYIQRMREEDNIRRLTASEKERRDFMVNISHDLRTPLAIARGYAETLFMKKGELSPDEERTYSDLVVAKLSQVDKMVNQLFELSKMESASFEAHREPFVFSEMMQEVLHAMDAGDRIRCENGTDGSWIEADVSMMERVVQNLVGNALAYSPVGGSIGVRLDRTGGNRVGDVRIGANRIGDDRIGGELLFTIANEGPALADELVHWINTPAAARPARSAIGLAIVRKILLLHGFGFSAEVKEGKNVFVVRMAVYAG